MRSTPSTVPALLAAAAMVLGLSVAAPASAQSEGEQTERIAGVDRVATAAEIAEATFDSSDTALLARAGDFPDALAASGLAGRRSAPVLLNPRDESVTNRTAGALENLGVQRVTVLGGPQAVSERTEESLRDRGYETERIQGDDRYGTAAEIARTIGADRIGQVDGDRTVLVAFGGRFPDALSAGPVAYHDVLPVLLSTSGHLHDAAADAMEDLGAEHAILVGGPAVLSERVERQIRDLGITTERLAGRDRTDTSRDVADFAVDRLGWVPDAVLLSRGDAFPDALAAAPHGGERHAPVLLSRSPDILSYDVLQWTVDHAEQIDVVRAMGGPAAVSHRILERLAAAAVPPQQTLRYTVGVKDEHGAVHAEPGYFAEHADWTLTDRRGWALDNDYRYTRVPQGEPASFHLWLASPEDVAAAADACSAEWSCRVGDDIYINDRRWRQATDTYDHRTLDEYRHYVVTHEVGHWLRLDHLECDEHQEPGEAAPVMDQQSISTGECTTNVWPLPFERDRARDNIGTGGTQSTDDQVDVE